MRHYGITTDKYKLIHFYYDIDEWELYDLEKDPQEMKNIYGDPAYADVLDNGHCLICDTGNARVIELDERGYIVWHYGTSVVSRRLLSYPRSVDVTGSGGYLVADTAHDRIIEILDGQIRERPFQDQPGLFWPRCVRMLPGGSLLIADARNSRIVEVSSEGHVLRALSHIDLDGQQALQDPHDVRLLPDGRYRDAGSSNRFYRIFHV